MKGHRMGGINTFWVIRLFRGGRPLGGFIHSWILVAKDSRLMSMCVEMASILASMLELRATILALSCLISNWFLEISNDRALKQCQFLGCGFGPW
jgi:hypothetical protein